MEGGGGEAFFISDAFLPFYNIPLLFLITTGTDKTFDRHRLFLVVGHKLYQCEKGLYGTPTLVVERSHALSM